MAKGRMLNRTIAYDEKLNDLTPGDQLLYIRMLPFTDDYGRLTGNLFELKNLVIPSWGCAIETLRKSLLNIESVGLIGFVENQVIEFLGFEKNQKIGHRRQNSLYPAISELTDIEKKRSKKVANGQIKTNVLKAKNSDEFLEFWGLYPSKRRFDKLKNSIKYDSIIKNVDHKIIVTALKNHIKYEWKDLEDKLIPHLSTWLNQNRWEMDVVTPSQPMKKELIKMICNSCDHKGRGDGIGTIQCPKCKEYDYMSEIDARMFK